MNPIKEHYDIVKRDLRIEEVKNLPFGRVVERLPSKTKELIRGSRLNRYCEKCSRRIDYMVKYIATVKANKTMKIECIPCHVTRKLKSA